MCENVMLGEIYLTGHFYSHTHTHTHRVCEREGVQSNLMEEKKDSCSYGRGDPNSQCHDADT